MGYAPFTGDDNTPLRPDSPALASQYAPLAVDQFVDPFPDWFGGGTVNEAIADLTNELSARPVTAVYLNGTSGNYILTPDDASLDITGDLEIVARIQIPVAGSNRRIIGKETVADTSRSYGLMVNSTNGLNFVVWNAAGTAVTNISSTTLVASGYAAGDFVWVKSTIRVSDSRVQFFHAADSLTEPTSWTQLGTDITATGITDIRSGSSGLEIGSRVLGTLDQYTAAIVRAIVRNGIDGTTVADFRADTPAGPRYRDSTGKVWTYNGSAWAFVTVTG